MAAVCVNCGSQNPDDATHCDDCGVELGRSTTPDTHPDEAVDRGESRTEREQET